MGAAGVARVEREGAAELRRPASHGGDPHSGRPRAGQAGTVVDDSACPNNPSTIVWLGGGNYPAPTAGIRVTSDRGVWDRAVANWKAAHGHS